MADAPDLPPLGAVIARYGLRARKSLGQNFLLDINLTRRIARAAGDLTQCTVWEVGPGPGGLTRALLLEGARHVVAIERDARCLDALGELAAAFPGRLTLIAGDALTADEPALLAGFEGPVRVVANLPYNIGTALLVKWLTPAIWPPWYAGLSLMFQREVAARLVAAPRGKEYGRLSVLAQWRCAARRLFDIPPQAFTPPPKVTSSLVALDPRPEPLAPAEADTLAAVTAAAFGQRRKMLRASLRALQVDAEALCAEAGVAPTARAEELSVAQFCALARAYDRRR
jgi:16S rRNA (adenine1518-N6/adenine1519-N6)-dimethyltransferase